ncbi:MAG: RdgB/HAM1 family non-canonical purine NTP pyrophosphatase [Gemmatimonadota bacterium]
MSTPVRELLVATRNAGKIREIRRILADVPGLRVLDLDEAGIAPSAEEDGLEPYETFEENARSKAEYFHRKAGIPTVADDSGIAVDALGGAPGVRSKRFAPTGLEGTAQDEANNRFLVERLQGVVPDQRTARYVCVAVMVDDSDREILTRGEAEGRIVDQPRGTGGFGYDPHVFIPELGKTFAELTPAEKDARSHRGAAFRALAAKLRASAGTAS